MIHASVVKKAFKPVVAVIPITANVLRYVIAVIAVKALIAARVNQLFPRTNSVGEYTALVVSPFFQLHKTTLVYCHPHNNLARFVISLFAITKNRCRVTL